VPGGDEQLENTRERHPRKVCRFAPFFHPAFPRWASLCRASGAGGLVGYRFFGRTYRDEPVPERTRRLSSRTAVVAILDAWPPAVCV